MGQRKGGQDFLFLANHPCLDFVNTQLVLKGRLTDLLESFEDLVAWLVESHQLRKSDAEAARREFSQDEKAVILEQAKTFRATLRNMVEDIARGHGVPKTAVAAINELLLPCVGYRHLLPIGPGSFKQVFVSSTEKKESLLASLAVFASDLLSSADLALIKKCKNPACVLYFYDTTKNHARNWCSMQLCGNRDKVAAYFKRKRQLDK
jgi:predicted RNA-binding Zn ribbon-like protein